MKQISSLDKEKAICENCERLVTTTYSHRDVPVLSDGTTVNILANVCDECDCVVGIPHQEVWKIKEKLEELKL